MNPFSSPISGDPKATITLSGDVELATDAETVTGASDLVVTTPGNITAKMSAPGAIGNTTPGSGAFTTIGASGVITSTLADGTAPLTIASTTKVTNLNVDQLDGADWAAPAAIGSGTPAAGTFTTLTANEGKFGATTRVTINDGANEDGITFASLGTATKGIDLSGSGLSGSGDYWIYNSTVNYWKADGKFYISSTATVIGELYAKSNIEMTGQLYTTSGNNIRLQATSAKGLLIGDVNLIGTWVGDGVSNGTTTITDVGGAAHGLSLAAGDLVHITDSTTAADEGFYRIVSDDGTSVVVDRALSGSNTDLAVTFYKDVIGFFATDGTNGQRSMNYSHQNKPWQLGGDVPVSTTGLASDDIIVGGSLGIHDQKITAGSGSGITVNNSSLVNRQLYKVTTTYVAYTDSDTTKGIVIATLPAKMKIVGFYADTTAAYTGGTTNAATMVVGITAESAAEIIASHNVFAGAILAGDADADMGTSMTRAAAIQGGYMPSWTGTTAIYATLVIVNDILSNLTAGSTTFYIETEQFQ